MQIVSDAETAKKVLGLIDKLEDLEAVQKVYANFEIADEIIAQIKS